MCMFTHKKKNAQHRRSDLQQCFWQFRERNREDDQVKQVSQHRTNCVNRADRIQKLWGTQQIMWTIAQQFQLYKITTTMYCKPRPFQATFQFLFLVNRTSFHKFCNWAICILVQSGKKKSWICIAHRRGTTSNALPFPVSVNNLPKVVAQQRRSRASKPRLLDRKSDTLPLSHHATPKMVQNLATRPRTAAHLNCKFYSDSY